MKETGVKSVEFANEHVDLAIAEREKHPRTLRNRRERAQFRPWRQVQHQEDVRASEEIVDLRALRRSLAP